MIDEVQAREDILARIRQATADVTQSDPQKDAPITWQYGRGIDMDDVVGTFVQRVRDYNCSVVEVPAVDVPQAVVDALKETGADESVVVPPGLDESWRTAIAEAGIEVRVDDPELSKTELDDTQAVVTAAASGVADTGTIVLTHLADQGRRALTLVPDRHVCVIKASQVAVSYTHLTLPTSDLV